MTNSALEKIWVLAPGYNTDLPEEAYEEIRELWAWAELGNDTSVYKTTLESLRYVNSVARYPNASELIKYLESKNISETEQVWINWSW